MIGVDDHAPITSSTGPPIFISGPDQLGSASGRGLESPPPTVSDHAALMIVVANYWSV